MENKRSGFGIAVKAVIWHEGRFLILKRSKSTAKEPDLWEFPGGGLELGEKHEAALKREIMEETGLTAEVIRPLSVWDATRKDGTQVLGVTFLCRLLDGTVSISEEHEAYAWIIPTDIEKYPVFSQMIKEVKSWSL